MCFVTFQLLMSLYFFSNGTASLFLLSLTHRSLSAGSLALESKKLLHLCKGIGGFLRLWGHDWNLSRVVQLIRPVLFFADDLRLTESAVHAWGDARGHE